MTAFRFDHMGVAVADLDQGIEVYRKLFGYRVLSGPFDDPTQQARVCFLGTGQPGGFVIELIAPLNDKSHVARVIAKGVGAYHACYEVDDIEKTVADMRAQRCVVVSEPVPAVAYEGRRIAWLYTPARQLVELVEGAKAGKAPAKPDDRAEVDRLVGAGDAAGAYARLGALWRGDPSPATAGFVVSRFEKIKGSLAVTPCRVAFLRSYTVEPAVPLLRAGAAVGGIDVSVHVGEFNAYTQEVLDPASPVFAFDPQVVVLAVQTRDIAPDLWSRFADMTPADAEQAVRRVVGAYEAWLKALRSRSNAHVIIHGLELPDAPAAGLVDAQDPAGQAACVRRINEQLVALARKHAGVCVLDYDALVSRHGRDAWRDERKWLTMRMPIAAPCLIHLANEWLRFLHPITGRVAKALVLDLDNTLWGGVIGEDGMTGIKIGAEHPGAAYLEFQRAILDLHQRGVILAICSKNNPDDANEVLERHPEMLLRPSHFAAVRINWSDKARNLREIAQELNIGVDALAFFDDNPAERELVRAQLPEIAVLEPPDDPMGYARALRDWPVFERLTLSAEDRERGKFYAQDRQRNTLQASATSLEEFYRSLEQEAELGTVTPETLARVAQLTQKTNQFNLTTKRYSEQQITELAADPLSRVLWLRVRDRFGDNGIVGVAITRPDGDAWEIDSLLMSCRVIGRTVETAVLAALIDQARAAGATAVRGWFIATKKNAPAKDFYRAHGFACVADEAGKSRWELDLTRQTVETPPWIRVLVSLENPA